MSDLQKRIEEWGQMRFPESTPNSVRKHLAEECIECVGHPLIEKTLVRMKRNGEALPTSMGPMSRSEAADVVILLMRMAAFEGWDLMDAVERKFAEVQTREWKFDPERGYSRHIG